MPMVEKLIKPIKCLKKAVMTKNIGRMLELLCIRCDGNQSVE